MRNFLIFFSIVITIYVAANYYVVRRLWQALSDYPVWKYGLVFAISAMAASYILGRVLENYYHNTIVTTLIWIGALWMAALLYSFLMAALFDLLRVLNYFFGIFPKIVLDNWSKAKLYSFLGSSAVVLITLVIGYINNLNTKVVELDFDIPKRQSTIDKLKIVMASDIHLGTTITHRKINHLINLINQQNPDIILFAGDILDEDPHFVEFNGMGKAFLKLQAKYGVWGINGNHEYIGGIENAEKFIKSIGINLLKDSVVAIDNAFVLIGRDDLSKSRFTNSNRKSLDALVSQANPNLPAILLDHQPFNLEETARYSIDLQLSGHTHYGQLFPFNYVTDLVYEQSWGYLKKGDTHFYISSGFGVWGPPIRTVNRSEIIVINLNFK